MRIIPVIDLYKGHVVQAVSGNRETYRPIKSVLTPSSRPLDIALTFKKYGFRQVYLADIDAILGSNPDYSIYRELVSKTGIEFFIDAGISDVNRAIHVINCGARKLVIGTETLTDLNALYEISEQLGREKIVCSIDVGDGDKILSKCESISILKPRDLAKVIEPYVSEIFVIFLERVGTLTGVDQSLVKNVAKSVKIPVIVGGGIKNVQDILELKQAGIGGVLVATALHKGLVKIDELVKLFNQTSK